MLDNLLQNAYRYGRENGWIKVILSEKESGIVLKVADNGMGIGKKTCRIYGNASTVPTNSRRKKGWGWVFHWYSRLSSIIREGSRFQALQERERNFALYLKRCGMRNKSLLFLGNHILFTE